MTSDANCNTDAFVIRDGSSITSPLLITMCTSSFNNISVKSSQSTMLIEYRTSSTSLFFGFTARFHSTEDTGWSTSYIQSAAFSFGGIGLIVFVLIFTCRKALLRNRRPDSTPTTGATGASNQRNHRTRRSATARNQIQPAENPQQNMMRNGPRARSDQGRRDAMTHRSSLPPGYVPTDNVDEYPPPTIPSPDRGYYPTSASSPQEVDMLPPAYVNPCDVPPPAYVNPCDVPPPPSYEDAMKQPKY